MPSQPSKLTRNQQLVRDQLDEAGAPMSAYALLDALRPEGIKAPLQIYRALEKLIASGQVHRIESLNAFVACCDHDHHQDESHGEALIFMICDECGDVAEISDHVLTERMASLCAQSSFKAAKKTVEISGLCASCAA